MNSSKLDIVKVKQLKQHAFVYRMLPMLSAVFFGVFVFMMSHAPAEAAIAATAATCTAANNTSNTSISCSVATESIDAGNVAVLILGMDNLATSDGSLQNPGPVSIVDSRGNPWMMRQCQTNNLSGAATGATTCIATARIATLQ
jgi:hypothetical protein